MHWLLATSTTNSDTVNNIALLGLVTKTASLVRTRWSGSAVDDVQLAKLYYALSANVQRVYSKEHQKRCPHPRPRPRRQYSNMFAEQIRSIGSVSVSCRKVDLSYLPASDTEKESQNIRLLLLLKLFDIFEGAHCVGLGGVVVVVGEGGR